MKEPVLLATRFSDPKQIGGTSTEVQVDTCTDFCEKQKFEIIAHHKVEAESAKATNIARIIDLLEFCRQYKGIAKYLVVYKVDRFARDVASHYYLKTELLKMGIVLRSATEPIDETPTGELMETILAALAQFQNSVKKEQVKISMRKLLEQGIWQWQCPTGYINKKNSFDKSTIPEVDDACAYRVEYIFQQFATGAVTQTQLSRELEKQKTYDHKGDEVKFSPQLIDKILRNSFYAGILYVPKWDEEFEGAHKPLVDKPTFYKCQKLLGIALEDTERLSLNPDFPLRDQLYCDYCSKKMTAAPCKGKNDKFMLYYCYNKKCPNAGKKSIHKIDFEREFAQYLEIIRPDEEKFGKFKEALLKRYEQRKYEFETQSSTFRKQLDIHENEKANIIKLGRQGALEPEEVKAELDKIKKTISELKLQINESHEEEFKIDMLIEYAESFFRTMHLFWIEALPSQKVRLQRILFPHGIIYSYPGFSNTVLAPGFNVIREFVPAESSLVTPRGIEPLLTG